MFTNRDESYIHQYRAGSSNKNDGGIIYDVEHYVIHPDFVMTDNYIYHDITFVRMKQPFSFSEYIQPIKLADKEPEEGAEALISGWGAIKVLSSKIFIFQTEHRPLQLVTVFFFCYVTARKYFNGIS